MTRNAFQYLVRNLDEAGEEGMSEEANYLASLRKPRIESPDDDSALAESYWAHVGLLGGKDVTPGELQ